MCHAKYIHKKFRFKINWLIGNFKLWSIFKIRIALNSHEFSEILSYKDFQSFVEVFLNIFPCYCCDFFGLLNLYIFIIISISVAFYSCCCCFAFDSSLNIFYSFFFVCFLFFFFIVYCSSAPTRASYLDSLTFNAASRRAA